MAILVRAPGKAEELLQEGLVALEKDVAHFGQVRLGLHEEARELRAEGLEPGLAAEVARKVDADLRDDREKALHVQELEGVRGLVFEDEVLAVPGQRTS